MNEQDYNLHTLAWGVGIALAIVFVGILIVNLPEIINIIATEGLLSE